MLDLPRGSTLEDTDRTLKAAAERLADLPELISIQAYAGAAAPFNFNGLVRHYYLRNEPQMGDLSVNLKPKDERKRASHAIALDIRKRLAGLSLPAHAVDQGRRGPAGPAGARRRCSPKSMAPTPRRGARPPPACAKPSSRVDFVVDVDDSYGVPTERLRFAIDQEALEYHGVEEQAVYDTLGALIGGTAVGYSQRGSGLKPILIKVALPRSALTLDERLLSTPLPAGGTARQGANVELGDVVTADARDGVRSRSSATTAASRKWSAAELAGRYRGADLRHARRRRRARQSRLGRGRQAGRRAPRSAARRIRSRRCCGTANGR